MVICIEDVTVVLDSPTMIDFLGFLDFGIVVRMRAKSSTVSMMSSTSDVRPVSTTFAVRVLITFFSILKIVIFVACLTFVEITATMVSGLDNSIFSS